MATLVFKFQIVKENKMAQISLNANQQAVANQIINYGTQHGYSASDIANAVKASFIESSLGESRAVPPPDTATGIFGYNNGNWDTYHAGDGDKNNDANATKAFLMILISFVRGMKQHHSPFVTV